ncbi:MAG: indolepyruvate oxidoreductase subunit beta [Candidatus Cloacimonetes bacterium]|nr:indolepyruvate oxidoreductase subunit beta [Candidatus Cloacimonadota bacterium]
MKKDIILAGVGGQGILSIAAIIGFGAVESGFQLKQAEVHGMSQRGGDVQSHLRISDRTIYSDLVPLGSADLILSVEPMEALRYKPYLSESGWLVTNIHPFLNISDYPDMEELMKEIRIVPHHITLDANQISKELQAPRSMNMVMLGAAAPFLDIDYRKLQDGIRFVFGRKGEEIVEMNLRAMAAGKKQAEQEL